VEHVGDAGGPICHEFTVHAMPEALVAIGPKQIIPLTHPGAQGGMVANKANALCRSPKIHSGRKARVFAICR
jgi:hypothetical protein